MLSYMETSWTFPITSESHLTDLLCHIFRVKGNLKPFAYICICNCLWSIQTPTGGTRQAWIRFIELTRTHPQSTPGWGGSHRYRCWPQDSHTCQPCSYNRRQHALHGGLCWVSGLRSRASWHCRRYGLFWCQLCRELDEETEQIKHVLR